MHIVRNMHMYLPCKREIYAKHFAPQIVSLDSKNLFSLTHENLSHPQFVLYLILELVALRTLPQQREKIFRNFIPRVFLPSVLNLRMNETESSRVIWLQLISQQEKYSRSEKYSPSLNCIFDNSCVRQFEWKNGVRFWLNRFSEVKGTPALCRLA